MLRKFLIGAGVLLAVLLVVVVALVTLVDVNRFKPQIEQYVQERYQRNLRIDGEIGLAVFPSVALSLPPSRLSEPGGTGEAASLAGARISVAVLPLLRGAIVAERVTVDGLKANIERRADGSLNIDDLLGTGGASSAPAGAGAPEPAPGSRPRFDIGGITLTDGHLVFTDRQAGNAVTISGLGLTTGRIANRIDTPVTLKFALASTNPEARGDLSLKADVQIDLDRKQFGARRIDATLKAAVGATRVDPARLKLAALSVQPDTQTLALEGLEIEAGGRLAADSFEAKVDLPRLALTQTSAAGEALQATVRLSGSRVVEATVQATGIGGSAKALTVANLAIDAMSRQDNRTLQAKLGTPAKADLSAGVVDLPSLAGSVLIRDPAIPEGAATIGLTGAASADTRKETAKASLTAKAPGTVLVAKLDVRDFGTPKIGFDISADQLDVDRYFPPVSAAGPAGGAGSGGGAGSASGAGSAAGGDRPVDLSALAELALDGKLSVGRLQARGVKATDLRVVMKAADGRLAVSPISAGLYGGRLAATATVRAGVTAAGNRVDTTADFTGVSIGPLLRDLTDKDLLEGRGNLKLALSTAGGTVGAMKRAVDGTAALHLRDGAIKGINLGETIRAARGLLAGAEQRASMASDASKQTDFTELGVTFVITDGVASSNDLDIKSPLVRIGGEGRADLVAARLDYTLRASVVGTSTGQGGKELDDLRGVTIPVRLSGPFDRLDWQIDWETAGKEALKSRAAAELRKRLKTGDLEEKAREKLGDAVGDALKGLFKR